MHRSKLPIHPVSDRPPPPWACNCGDDQYGVFAEFEIKGVVQKMRWVPPGRFMMGSPEREEGRFSFEGPRHSVTIHEGFWLGETPCTLALWKVVTGENPSNCEAPDHPVEQVSWEDCRRFFEALESSSPGLKMRFATEAEWEYACRAETEEARYGELDEIAWHSGNRGDERGTRPVKLKEPNAWGLYDMLGNVREWTMDWCGGYPTAAVVDPIGPVEGSTRISRGGSWAAGARYARAASRQIAHPHDRIVDLGFRLARDQS